jgi:crossover junction endodeoxyribonuclease RuvC
MEPKNLQLTTYPLRFLGIDPGYQRMGLAVIEKNDKGKESLIYSDCVETNKSLPHTERLRILGEAVRKTIKDYEPTHMGIEKLYFNGNQKTAMFVAEARGVMLLCGAEAGLVIAEFTPPEIKLAIAGYGRADKKQVFDMLSKLITIPKIKRLDDEYDAIATALTASACHRN